MGLFLLFIVSLVTWTIFFYVTSQADKLKGILVPNTFHSSAVNKNPVSQTRSNMLPGWVPTPAAGPNPFDSPNFVKTPEELEADFTFIRNTYMSYTGTEPEMPPKVESAMKTSLSLQRSRVELQNLMAYRAIVGVPFRDMSLDKTQSFYATAGAMLLDHIGKLDHTPPKPDDYPQDLYDLGYKGTSSGNLFMNGANTGMEGCVVGYMNDSDSSNIDRIGHRRWCINPYMKTTGFGEFGCYSVMWAFDFSRPNFKFDYDIVAFPACGLTPVNMIDTDWVWNVSINPSKFRYLGDDKLKVTVTPAVLNTKTAALRKSTRPALELNYLTVNQESFGISRCVIFRPVGIVLQSGAAYCVEIDGFATPSGRPHRIEYWVVFCQPM